MSASWLLFLKYTKQKHLEMKNNIWSVEEASEVKEHLY